MSKYKKQRIRRARPIDPDLLFAEVLLGKTRKEMMIENERVLGKLAETIKNGTKVIPYDGGLFGVEVTSPGLDALRQTHQLKTMNTAMRTEQARRQVTLLGALLGATVSVSTIGYNPGQVYAKDRMRKLREGFHKKRVQYPLGSSAVQGVIIGVDLDNSQLELENERFNKDSGESVIVDLLNKLGVPGVSIASREPGRKDSLSIEAQFQASLPVLGARFDIGAVLKKIQ